MTWDWVAYVLFAVHFILLGMVGWKLWQIHCDIKRRAELNARRHADTMAKLLRVRGIDLV